VKCPPTPSPLTPVSDVIYQRYTVGGGDGPLMNMYTVDVPAGTQSITVRCIGGGAGGGASFGEIFQFDCDGTDKAQIVSAGGGGGGGRVGEVHRPWAPGFPTQLNIEVGYASATPSDPVTGVGADGEDSIATFSPFCPGFEEVRAIGGKGGNPGMSVSPTSGIAGGGGDGGNGGGGGGGGVYTCGGMAFPFPFAVGGQGLDRDKGDDGDLSVGGDGGLNANSGSSGISVVGIEFGGGGGGAAGVVDPDSGGLGGPPGDLCTSNAGGDYRIQDTGAAGAGAGIYCPLLAEVGTTVFAPGGRGSHGRAEVWFYVYKIPS